jgi:hypothetical protein
MRKFLFVLASTGSLATMNAAIAQYPASEYYATGSYVPGYYGRRYYAPGYPGYYAPGYTAPGYRWREQRLNEELRTNPQLRETYENQRTPNNTMGSGSIGLSDPNAVGGECAKGFSEETCRRRGQTYNPPRQN